MAEKDEKPSLVHVEVFGQTYAVRAGANPGYVETLAAFVDDRMKDVSRTSGAVDSLRIAVLAALNLADEFLRSRRDLEQARQELESARTRLKRGASAEERARRLATALGAALGE
ncbi:MAG TPA: cell division protein ZapA [Vicinamibacteria bacterium]|nr:cell division protein ZapA [Vicinamibacteria bacterium]